MTKSVRHLVERPGQVIPILLILIFGTAASTIVFFVGRQWEQGENATEFNYAAVHPVEAIRRSIERIELVNEALREYYYGTPNDVSRDEFVTAAVPFFSRVPSLKLWQWAPRVSGGDRETFEKTAQSRGLKGYQITERRQDGEMVRAGRRDEYFPILYAASQSACRARLGWDLGSDSSLLAALERSQNSDQMIVTGHFDGDDNQGPFVMTILPVYRNPRLVFTVEDRRRELEGFIVGACSIETFIDDALGYDSGPRGIDMRVYDGADQISSNFLYYHRSRMRQGTELSGMPAWSTEADESFANINYTTSLLFGGRRWTLACKPAPHFFAAHAQWRSQSALGAGLFFTILIATYVHSVTSRRERIERIVIERTLELRKMDERLRQSQEMRARGIRVAHEETIHRLVTASLCRDEETGMHIRRTGLLSEALSRAAGWSESDSEIIRMAAPMHDVGKIGIPDAVLRKPDKLTPAEFDIMKRHTFIGARMLEGSRSAILAMARDIALCHHERWGGGGYPRNLKGDDIPEAARIVSIVDVYDALSHDRIYHKAMSEDEVLKILRDGSGNHFDPLLLAVFFAHYEEMRRITKENPDKPIEESGTASIFSFVPTGSSLEDENFEDDMALSTADSS